MQLKNIANLNNERVNSKQKKKGNELKIVNTKAFVIPTRSSTRNSCSILTVVGLKKYYNFFNNGSLVLKTHFMSDQTNYITLKTKKGSKLSETNITTPDIIMPIVVDHSYILSKMKNWKIMQRSDAIQVNKSEFSSEQELNDNITQAFMYCTENKCSACREPLRFRLSEINRNNTLLTQAQINDELKAHGHPKSRKNRITRVNRSLNEAKLELRNHYIKNHYTSQDS